MRLLLVCDTYPPARISGALQMRDLAVALAELGHEPVVLTPAANNDAGLEFSEGVQVLRVSAPRTKDVPYLRRTLAEFVLPWALLRGLRRSTLRDIKWDGLVWYSPTIFLGHVIRSVKRKHKCPSYLIVRDLFPDWAVDAGVLGRGSSPYRFFKAAERFQYRQADVIGVQTPSNVALVAKDAPAGAEIEVLHNWLSAPRSSASDKAPSLGKLSGRINFVYAGNMGVAQDMDAFVDLARRMRDRRDVGFLFVGRGSESKRLKAEAEHLSNLLVLEEVAPEVLPGLLAQCHVGIVALHPSHETHNIPGKLLTYLHSGLPVLARVNSNNDLVDFVNDEGVGLVVAGDDAALLHAYATRLADDAALRKGMARAGQVLAERMFSPRSAAFGVINAISPKTTSRPIGTRQGKIQR